MQRSLVVVVSAFALALAVVGCGPEKEISIDPPTADVTVGGDPVTFTAVLDGFDERPGMVSWRLDGPGTTSPPVIKVIT